jgi:hypothetical protein
MKVIILSLLIILSVFKTTSAHSNLKLFDFDPKYTSNITNFKNDPYPAYYHLLYAAQYILLGKPDPSKPDIFEVIDGAPDELTLFEMIGFGSQGFYVYWTENDYDENGFEGIYKILDYEN